MGLPAVISFTVETDGRLPSGQTLGDAIAQVDDAAARSRLLHGQLRPPDALRGDQLESAGSWLARVHGVRANASRLSHAELDEATELDRGDVDELGGAVRRRWARGRPAGRRRVLRHRPRARRHDRRRARHAGVARESTSTPFVPLRNFSLDLGGPVMTTTLLTRNRLWVDDRGDGPPVLLIAGLGDPAEAWTFQQEGLSSRYRTIAFDNRGVGRSPLPDTPLTVAGMADDVATILDELGIDRADIVGFSGGSVTAQELAIRHPERVKSLVLMGTFGKGDRYFDAAVRMFTWMIDQAPDPQRSWRRSTSGSTRRRRTRAGSWTS